MVECDIEVQHLFRSYEELSSWRRMGALWVGEAMERLEIGRAPGSVLRGVVGESHLFHINEKRHISAVFTRRCEWGDENVLELAACGTFTLVSERVKKNK